MTCQSASVSQPSAQWYAIIPSRGSKRNVTLFHSDRRLMAAAVSLNLNLIDFKEVTPKRILERNLGEITIRQAYPIPWLFQWDE